MNTIETLDATPFKHLVMSIGELPSSFVDSMSYYECMAWLVAYIRDKVIPACNNNAEAIKEIQEWIETLDLQEYVDNKLDEMLESGELATIIANYLVISGGNAKELGCAGDGVTDDTSAINAAITTLVNDGIGKLVFPEGTYKVTGQISVPSNFVIEGMEGAVIKYVGDGKTGYIFLLQGASHLAPVENITIRNINIDCTSQTYKGGANDANPSVTSTTPKYKGLQAIRGFYCKNIKIEGCHLKDVYGDGIVFSRCAILTIKDNYLEDCSGGNPRSGGDSGYDSFGDGITCFGCWGVEISNNTIINQRVYQASATASDIGTICGRSGLEFEYPIDQNSAYAPDYDIFYSTDGIGLKMSNNFVYGYTKGSHFEDHVKVQFNDNTIINCYIGTIASIDGGGIFKGNYYNDNNCGQAIQSGYDDYSAGIAFTHYGDNDNKKFVVSGNIFDNVQNPGITVGKSKVIIENNVFNDGNDIRSVSENANDIIVSNNNFHDAKLSLYQNKDWSIAGNIFDCASTAVIYMSAGCKDISIKDNTINNSVSIEGTSENIVIEGNKFITESGIATLAKNNHFIDCYISSNKINNNIFDMRNNDTCRAFSASGAVNSLEFNYNIILNNDTRTTEDVKLSGTSNKVSIIGNKLYGASDNFHAIASVWNCVSFTILDNISDNQFAWIFYQSNGNTRGLNKISNNQAGVRFGSTANNSTDRFNNLFLSQGQVIENYDSNSAKGWKVTRSGIYTENDYASGAVAKGAYIKSNGYVYKVVTAGTSQSAPTGTTTGATETDNDVVWICCGQVATLVTL